MAAPSLDLATISVVAAAMLAMMAVSLFHVAIHSPVPTAVRSWGHSCLLAALGLVLKSVDSWQDPGVIQAAGDVLLGASVILQAVALARFTRYSDRIVRTLVVFNVLHLMSAIQFAALAPNPLVRVVCTDLIGAAALLSAAIIVWRPSRKEYTRVNQLIAVAYALGGLALLTQGLMSWRLASLEATEVMGWAYLLNTSLHLLLPLALLTISYGQLACQLASSALLDPLTQARNRRGLTEAWSLLQARARRGDEGWHVGVILLDIDLFRKVNQTHGYAAGDGVLQLAVEVMRATARRYDTIGRFGGEEFCMLLPGVTIRQAQVVTERVRRRFTELAKERSGIDVTISAGITVANAGESDMEHALDAADQMLYVAKREGRDRARVDPDALRVAAGMEPVKGTGRQNQLGFPLV
ncbi:MAG TPA: GGDEF domain-containing protein [Lautropia sp.]|nr:GGDEF domain-containing protein [Lautropia sp.]